jgi:hypothetical protein
MNRMSPRPGTPEEPPGSDPPRDAALGSALRRADVIASDVDALHRTIIAAAQPRLESLERSDEWWDWTARWGRAAIPIACAAGVIGIGATALLALPAEEQTMLRAPVVAFATVASPAVTGTQLMDSLVGPATHDWVLNGAVSR